MKTTTIGWFGALALGASVGLAPAAFAQMPGATIGLPADLGDLGATRSTDGPTAAGGNAARGAARTNPGGSSRGMGVQGTGNGTGTGRPQTGGSAAGAGGSGAGIAASPSRNDDYLNPLYGRGSR